LSIVAFYDCAAAATTAAAACCSLLSIVARTQVKSLVPKRYHAGAHRSSCFVGQWQKAFRFPSRLEKRLPACRQDATMAARKAACAAMNWPSMKLIRSTSASYAPATCDACAASFSPSAAKRPSKSSIRILIGDWWRNADSKRGTTLAANTPGPSQTPSIFRWSGECREPSPHLATWQTASRLLPSGSVTNAA
jgi:hypothetical protein